MFDDEPGCWYGCNSFPFLACMGPKHAPKDTCMYIFLAILVNWSMYLYFRFELWTLNA